MEEEDDDDDDDDDGDERQHINIYRVRPKKAQQFSEDFGFLILLFACPLVLRR